MIQQPCELYNYNTEHEFVCFGFFVFVFLYLSNWKRVSGIAVTCKSKKENKEAGKVFLRVTRLQKDNYDCMILISLLKGQKSMFYIAWRHYITCK